MNITTAKRIAKAPADFTESELHDALDVIVNDERLSESQVTKMQASIEAELNNKRATKRATKLTSNELLYGLNRAIWAIQESGRYEQAEAMRAIRDESFDYKVMGMED